MAKTADELLKEVGTFLTERRNDFRDARDEAGQQLQAEPGNGLTIEKLRVIGMLQNIQLELARSQGVEAGTPARAGSK